MTAYWAHCCHSNRILEWQLSEGKHIKVLYHLCPNYILGQIHSGTDTFWDRHSTINEHYTSRINELSEAESAQLLALLHHHAQLPDFPIRISGKKMASLSGITAAPGTMPPMTTAPRTAS